MGESAARRLWPGKDPSVSNAERVVSHRTDVCVWQTVIGVVGTSVIAGSRRAPRLVHAFAAVGERLQFLMVRTEAVRRDVVAAIRAPLVAGPRKGPGATVMLGVVATESAPWRFMVQVFAGFAPRVVRRGHRPRCGDRACRRHPPPRAAIRAAFGASRGQLRSAVTAEGVWLTAWGTGSDWFWLFWLHAVAALLIGVEPHDAIALGGAASCL